MLNPPTAPLTFYPAFCFPLSPTYNTWARLTAINVKALQERIGFEGQNLYFHLNHPIKWVRLVGLIVSFELISNRYILILDDFSGATLELTCTKKAPAPLPPSTTGSSRKTANPSEEADESLLDGSKLLTHFTKPVADSGIRGTTANGHEVDLSNVDIGSIVKVKGGIGEFRGEKQILLERIWVVKSTAEEAAAWAENLDFRRDVLTKPWVVKEEEMRVARREAEGLGRDRREEKRIKAKEHRSGRKDAKEGGRIAKEGRSRKGVRRSGEDKERRRMTDAQKKAKEAQEKQRAEQEDVRRKERSEAVRKMKEEQERRRRVEEEEKRKVAEKEQKVAAERERLVTARRQRNEAREKALKELGAGR